MRNFRSGKSVWDEALIGIDMALLLDPSEAEVAAAIAESREILERLRAKPYLERLDAAVARGRRPGERVVSVPARTEVAVTE